MTSVTRKSNISVSAAQSGSTQNALKLSVATSFILCLDEDVVQADEASTLSLSTALPITLKLLINGFPCQEFVDSAFARAFLGYIKRNAETLALDDEGIKVKRHLVDSGAVKAKLLLQPLPPETATLLPGAPRLEGIHITLKLTDNDSTCSSLASLTESVHQDPLSLNLTYLLENACSKLFVTISKRYPLVLNREAKQNVGALLNHSAIIASSLQGILQPVPTPQLPSSAYATSERALDTLADAFKYSRPAASKRARYASSNEQSEEEQDDEIPAENVINDNKSLMLSIRSGLLYLALHGLKLRAPKLQQSTGRGIDSEDDEEMTGGRQTQQSDQDVS